MHRQWSITYMTEKYTAMVMKGNEAGKANNYGAVKTAGGKWASSRQNSSLCSSSGCLAANKG
jgi:hypothetical protein